MTVKHIGYKAFDKNLRCRGFQYEVGKTYELSGSSVICQTGFHFCKKLYDVFKYYPQNEDTRVCEVLAENIQIEGDKAVSISTIESWIAHVLYGPKEGI